MRKRQRNKLLVIGPCVLLLAVMAGCAPHFNAAPQLQDKVGSIKTVAIMPPNIKVYQVGVTGVPQVMEEETATATARRADLTSITVRELGQRAGVIFTPFPAPTAGLDTDLDPTAARLAAELNDTQALFEVVGDSINLHALAVSPKTMRFAEKLTNLDYSLGPNVQQFAKLADADALLFTAGVDVRFSVGVKALRATANLPILFFRGPPLPIGGPTFLSVALVDATTGDILWYNVACDRNGRVKLTNPNSVTNLIARVLDNFPLGTPPPPCEYDEWGAWSCPPAPH